MTSSLFAISPLDGRYAEKVDTLREIFSEYGLMKFRVLVEIRWLEILAAHPDIDEVSMFNDDALAFLQAIYDNFSEKDAEHIKSLEKETNHDMKSVEYFLKEKMAEHKTLAPVSEFVHFACTSADINNLAYALMLKKARDEELLPKLNELVELLGNFADDYADVPMMSRTHGQPATPTTVGKEFANVKARVKRQVKQFSKTAILGKLNGATGNFNAHVAAYPNIDWLRASKRFVDYLGLEWNPHTTQIEPHDYIAEYCDTLSRLNVILIDFSRDMWGYISLEYFTQRFAINEVGSSTMPHKINPIYFENAEGNLGIANALFQHFSEKLPISRFQRDLSDSTVLRNLGVAIAYSWVSYSSLKRGLGKILINEEKLKSDLDNHWELLAEPIQTVMRRFGLEEPYEQLKTLTRKKKINQEILHDFIKKSALSDDVKKALYELTPSNYLGYAKTLAELE